VNLFHFGNSSACESESLIFVNYSGGSRRDLIP
jgi:hypothetical protein